jgi:hypothetical protein
MSAPTEKKEKQSPSTGSSPSTSKAQKKKAKIQKIIEREAWPARHTRKLPFTKKHSALIHHNDPVQLFNIVKQNAYGKKQKRFAFVQCVG